VGDLLFTRLSGTLDYVGNCVIVPAWCPPKMEYPDRLFCGQAAYPLVSRRYLQHCFGAKSLRKVLEEKAKSSAGHQRVGLADIRSFLVPLPPLAEQHRIVAEVDRQLSVLDEVGRLVDANVARCARLRQSILKRAFEGRLVPQNPDDEPASVLLERIKAQADATPKKNTRRRRGTA